MKTRLRIVTGKLLEPSGKEDICDQQYVAAQDAMELERELHAVRDAVIEEVAKSIEAEPLAYDGPDPYGASDLRYLMVASIRDMKGKK